jgi:hypothetical protein
MATTATRLGALGMLTALVVTACSGGFGGASPPAAPASQPASAPAESTGTRGGPGFSTDVIASTIYKQYQAGFYGLATAGNVILFIAVTLLVFPMMRFFNRHEIEL